jgi:hypothetical protein
MAQTKKAQVTANEVNNLRKRLNEEHRTISGAIKEVTSTELDLTKREKELLTFIGLHKGASNKVRSEAGSKIYANTRYYYISAEGKECPADRRTRKDANGKNTFYYVARETWSRKKVLEAIRVITGDEEREKVTIEVKTAEAK